MNCPNCGKDMHLDRTETIWLCNHGLEPWWFVRRDGMEYEQEDIVEAITSYE